MNLYEAKLMVLYSSSSSDHEIVVIRNDAKGI